MKILVLGFGNASGRYNPPSTHCENFMPRDNKEHEIVTFGYNEGLDIVINYDDEFEKVLQELPEGWQPDFCLMWLLEWNLLPRGIERTPFPTVAWIPDWDYNIPYTRTCGESVDLTVSHGEPDSKSVRDIIGSNNAQAYHGVGVMKEYYPERPKKIRERKYDILYTSWIDDAIQPGRSEWINRLCSLSDKYNVHIDKNLGYAEYVELLRDSKLVFSYSRHGSIAVRVADAGAQGAVVIDPGEETGNHFVPNEEYIPVTEDNFAEQIEKYLGDQDALQEMSDKFYKKVKDEFEARKRFEGLLKFIENFLKNNKSMRKFQTYTESEKAVKRGESLFYAHFTGAPGVFFINSGSRLVELSLDQFKKAVKLEPTSRAKTSLAIASATYGFLFLKGREKDELIREVISILENVILSDPNYAMAHYHLGLVHLKDNNLGKALQVFQKALEVFSDDKCEIDPWCLHNRDDYIFNQFIKRHLNENLLILCKEQSKKAYENIRNIFCAATLYSIFMIKEKDGNINDALEVLVESNRLNPDSGLIAMKTASLLSLLGYGDESYEMYKSAVRLLPLNINLKTEYIKMLYLYKRDREIMQELRNAMKITRSVAQYKEKATTMKVIMNSMERFIDENSYPFDSLAESLLNSWVEKFFDYLRKDPGNINFIIRIIQILDELGRTDKILEIAGDYTENHLKDDDESTQELFENIYDYLSDRANREKDTFENKLNELHELAIQ